MVVEQPNSSESTEEQEKSAEAQLQAARIENDFGHLDAQALREANEQPAINDYVNDLQSKLGDTHQILADLRSSVMPGEHKTDDLNKKIDFEKRLDVARNMAHSAFLKPEDPSRVEYQQTLLENAGENFQTRFIKQAEIMTLALKGDKDPNETYPGEASREYNVDNIREKLLSEQLTELQNKVSSSLEKLNNLQPRIVEIASSKALLSDEKDEVLKNYSRMFEEYQKAKTELDEILKDIEKARE